MISFIESSVPKAGVPLYHLKVVLDETKPVLWRRLQVPGNASLGWLHAVLQVAMGWMNCHLHQFRVGEQIYSDPAFELNEFKDDPPVFNENKITVAAVAPRPRDLMDYEYDFGDSWHHYITVEKILRPDPAASRVALCLDGARACPPEDCGGTTGYRHLLKILRNPKHKEHKFMKEWLDRPFDPEAFDLESVNFYLRKLKWPRTTESQLRKVLLARDDSRE